MRMLTRLVVLSLGFGLLIVPAAGAVAKGSSLLASEPPRTACER